MKENIKPATGRLGVLVVGVGGAVATTMITGTLAARKGLAKAIGSITQMATMRMQDGKEKLIKDIVPLADLNDIVFGGWDIFPDNAYEAAMYAEVLKEKDLNLVKDELQAIKPMPAAFDHNFAKRLNGTHIKKAADRWEMTEQLREDIRNFKAANNCERIAVLWAQVRNLCSDVQGTRISRCFGTGNEGQQYRGNFSEHVLCIRCHRRRRSVHYGCSQSVCGHSGYVGILQENECAHFW